METIPILRRLQNRAMFVQGLYRLLTDEERGYFWVREVNAVINETQALHSVKNTVFPKKAG